MSLPSVDDARTMMLARVCLLGEERVGLAETMGRILREDVRATRDQPPFDASAMDGWAVRKADSPGVLEIAGESAAGHGWSGTLGRGEAVRIATGAAVPKGADWVVIQEEAVREGDRVRVGPPGATGFIRARGADFVCGDTLLGAGTRLDPWRIALAASAGYAALKVSARPQVTIVATGDELVASGAAPGQWQIHDSVGPGLAAWFDARGCAVTLLDTLPDDRAAVSAALSGVDCDLLVTIGGASVGDHDVVKPALGGLGLALIVEGVAVRPGKPTWFGLFGNERRVLGLPGNPVSAMVCAELFAAPIVARMEGAAATHAVRRARLAVALPANGAREHYMRATLRYDAHGGLLADVAADQDSALVSILATAHALIRRPANAAAAPAGETVYLLMLDRASQGSHADVAEREGSLREIGR